MYFLRLTTTISLHVNNYSLYAQTCRSFVVSTEKEKKKLWRELARPHTIYYVKEGGERGGKKETPEAKPATLFSLRTHSRAGKEKTEGDAYGAC